MMFHAPMNLYAPYLVYIYSAIYDKINLEISLVHARDVLPIARAAR